MSGGRRPGKLAWHGVCGSGCCCWLSLLGAFASILTYLPYPVTMLATLEAESRACSTSTNRAARRQSGDTLNASCIARHTCKEAGLVWVVRGLWAAMRDEARVSA